MIHPKIEAIWSGTGAWPEYIEAMRQSLLTGQAGGLHPGAFRWDRLPGLCCQAAGGEPEWAEDVAIAWSLFYVAAHLMDSVEDKDQPDAWWAEQGAGVALNAASGLFFTANLFLNRLFENRHTRSAAPALLDHFYAALLAMGSGQHRDLVSTQFSLEEYWEIAARKSGSFFALACRSGASLACNDLSRLEAYHRFGKYLGTLLQILDDLMDIQSLPEMVRRGEPVDVYRSLPVTYALEVYPSEQRNHLVHLIQPARSDCQAAEELLALIEEGGAALYLAVEIERYRQLASESLAQADPQSPAGDILHIMLNDLGRRQSESPFEQADSQDSA